jgi:hypothetical protein
VLVVGGEAEGQPINTFEIYDPVEERFEQVPGTLSPGRSGYALASLSDGRVLIAGGFEAARPSDSIDLYDPAVGITSGGRMSTPRGNFTATVLSDGSVLFAGGSDGTHELASAEVYDPATGMVLPAEPMAAPRQRHVAVRPSHSDNVLISGGTAAGRGVDSAEVFVVSRNAFERATESASDDDGPSITIGALNSDGRLRSAKTYQVSSPPR